MRRSAGAQSGSIFSLFTQRCSTPQTVNVTAIQYPNNRRWPYDGTETFPFLKITTSKHWRFMRAAYARLKELGGEAQIGFQMLRAVHGDCEEDDAVQDRRDPLIFTMGYGAAGKTNPTTMR